MQKDVPYIPCRGSQDSPGANEGVCHALVLMWQSCKRIFCRYLAAGHKTLPEGMKVCVMQCRGFHVAVMQKDVLYTLPGKVMPGYQIALATLVPFKGPKKSRFLGRAPLVMDSPPSKPLRTAPYKQQVH